MIFWEDNMQMPSMMATVHDDGSEGTDWHAVGSQLYVEPEAGPRAAGLAGQVDFYTMSGDITYAPAGELAADPERIARFGGPDDDRWAIYSFDAGDRLADDSVTPGRRVYFGLYDDFGHPTFQLLTLDGVALFDAQIEWLSGSMSEAERP